jgi:hypothetical protein
MLNDVQIDTSSYAMVKVDMVHDNSKDLKLQQLLLKVGDRLRPLLKLSVLHIDKVLKVDNPVGTGLHLLTGNVE